MTKFYRTKKFKEQQKEWYKKLYDSGFSDIEYFNFDFSSGQDKPILDEKFGYHITTKLKRLKKENLRIEHLATYQHYSALRNFLAHGHLHPSIDRNLLKLYTEGLTYRAIKRSMDLVACPYPKRHFKGKIITTWSLFYIHTRLKSLKEKAFIWNHTNPEGIDTTIQDDETIY